MISEELAHALQVIRETEHDLRLSSLYGLSYMTDEGMEHFVEIWCDLTAEQRRRVVSGLVEIAEASFLVDFGPIFRMSLTDEDPEVRILALEGLWEDHDWHLADLMVRLLRQDPAPEVRAAAATALGDFVLQGELKDLVRSRAQAVCTALFETLESVDELLDVRRRALESLAYASDGRVAPLIEAAYQDEEPKMRVSALLAMGRTADPSWSSKVLPELRNSNPEARYEAVRACGELELIEAVPALAKLVLDRDREVQETAIWALGQIGGLEARRILEACYDDGDEYICQAIDDALANLSLMEESFDLAYHELLEEDLHSLEDLEENRPKRGKDIPRA